MPEGTAESHTKFFIAGVRRSGTTLMRTTLDSHPQIRCIGEAFHFSGRLSEPDGDKFSYQRYLHESQLRRIRDMVNRSATVEAYLDDLLNDPAYRAIGFKIMPKHARTFPEMMEYIHRHHLKCLHVVRKNVLKTLISRTVKKETRVAHARDSQKATLISLRTNKLLRDLERIDSDNTSWPKKCDSLPYLKVVYEEFVEDPERELRRMFEFLNVDYLPDVRSPLVKVNPNEIEKIVANYGEVADVLKGTKFEWCLTG